MFNQSEIYLMDSEIYHTVRDEQRFDFFDFQDPEQIQNQEDDEEQFDSEIEDQQNVQTTYFQSQQNSIPSIPQQQPIDDQQLQESVILQEAQGNELNILAQFKALFDLSIHQKKNIQLSLEDQQNVSPMIHQIGMDDQINENIIQQTIQANVRTQDQLDIMIQEAKESIINLNKKIEFDPNNYKLYLEKSKFKLILAYDKFQQQKSSQELFHILLLVHKEIFKQPNLKLTKLQEKIEFCQQTLQKLDKFSFDYLEIMMLILQTFDQKNPENSEQINILKSLTITSQFENKLIFLAAHQIQFLQQICWICISSIQENIQVYKLRQIKTLKQQARIYMIFAKMLTNHFRSTENNQEFQQAKKIFSNIVRLLNETEIEFPNNLGYLEFKKQILKEIIFMLEKNIDKIEFQKYICQIQGKICEKNPQILTLFYYVYEQEQLLNFLNRDDVQILKMISKIYDQMLELRKHDQNFLKRPFLVECLINKASICEKIAKQEQSLKLKEEYYMETLGCYEQVYKFHPYVISRNQIKLAMQIPIELGIGNRWNKHYDYILKVLEKEQNSPQLHSFFYGEFKVIMQRISQQEKSLFARELFKTINNIYAAPKNKSKDFLPKKAEILKYIGDLMNNEEQQLYYNECILTLDKVTSVKHVKSKVSLLIQLNRKLEALSVTKQFFKYNHQIRSYCYKFLQINSFLREARIVSRIQQLSETNNYNVKALQNNL